MTMPEQYSEQDVRDAWENIRDDWQDPHGELETAICAVYRLPNVEEDEESVRVILEYMFRSTTEPYTARGIVRYGERLGDVYHNLTEIADIWLDDQFGKGIMAIQKHLDSEGVGRDLVSDQSARYYEYAGSYYYFNES
jgi:hypothetical protein